MAADGASSSMNVCDITQCSICLETYKEPKALPCIHTFCLQCLDKHCEDKEQEEVACPLCRKVFSIPPGGNINLPNNFFILQLLQVKSSDAEKEKNYKRLCELCSDSEAEIPSTSYCIECDEHMCDRCSMTHTKSKLSKSHQVICEDEYPGRAKRIKLTVNYCDQHEAEPNRLFCYDCKMVACVMCSVTKHSKHYLTDVNESAEKFREQMKDDVDNVSTFASNKFKKIIRLEEEKSLFVKNITTAEIEISERCDQLISLIQSHKIELMEELNVFKNKVLKELETVKDEIERLLVITESFKRYCQEMMNKGTACDISRTALDLHARAEELVKTREESNWHKLSGVEITFKPSLSTTDSVTNFIGELVIRGSSDDTQKIDLTKFLESPNVCHVMPSTGQKITGITVLGSVLRFASPVNVYKSDDFTLIRNLTINGLTNTNGFNLVSCSHYNCLYASDYGQKIIYRYDLMNKVITSWSVGGKCFGLSVTKCYNVLATLRDTNRIQEYTTHGSLIREISLDSSIDQPLHCVQLSTGNYVVSHEGSKQHRVCIVDQSGHIIQSYGGLQGSGVGQLYSPWHLAVDIHDNVLVSDINNHRVQLLSPTLTYLGNIGIPGHQLQHPFPLYLEEQSRRLYIGEYTGGRIFALDINKNK